MQRKALVTAALIGLLVSVNGCAVPASTNGWRFEVGRPSTIYVPTTVDTTTQHLQESQSAMPFVTTQPTTFLKPRLTAVLHPCEGPSLDARITALETAANATVPPRQKLPGGE